MTLYYYPSFKVHSAAVVFLGQPRSHRDLIVSVDASRVWGVHNCRSKRHPEERPPFELEVDGK